MGLGLPIGALVILILYICGTIAVNVLSTPDEIVKSFGLIQFFESIDTKFKLPWVTHTVAFLLSFADIASLIVWLVAPVIIFFKCTPRGILPEIMHKTDKNGTPINAIIFQGVLVSSIIILTGLLPSVDLMYQILFLMSGILCFIPYLFLVFAYIKSAAKLNRSIASIISLGFIVFTSTLVGIIASFQPSSDFKNMHDIIIYEIELSSGPLIFTIIGLLIYKFRKIPGHRA